MDYAKKIEFSLQNDTYLAHETVSRFERISYFISIIELSKSK